MFFKSKLAKLPVACGKLVIHSLLFVDFPILVFPVFRISPVRA